MRMHAEELRNPYRLNATYSTIYVRAEHDDKEDFHGNEVQRFTSL